MPSPARVGSFQTSDLYRDSAGTPADPKEGERMNLAEHSFDCPVKYEGEHEPRVCAADDGKADAHEREIDWYERHLKQAQQERDEARAEVARLRAVVEAAKVLRQPEARGFSVALGEYAIWGAVQVVLDALAAYETKT